MKKYNVNNKPNDAPKINQCRWKSKYDITIQMPMIINKVYFSIVYKCINFNNLKCDKLLSLNTRSNLDQYEDYR